MLYNDSQGKILDKQMCMYYDVRDSTIFTLNKLYISFF